MKKNVLILFGGKSCEHDISIVSTFQVIKSLDEYLYNIYLVYIDKMGIFRYVKNFKFDQFIKSREKLKEVQLNLNDKFLYVKNKRLAKIDVLFPILHGINGEDGCISALSQLSNIPCVSSGLSSSTIGMDKNIFKKVLKDLPHVKHLTITESEFFNTENIEEKIEKQIGYPCIIKPGRLGSSIGINICENSENLRNLLKKSLNFDKKVIIEQYICNLREFNIALYRKEDELILSEIEEPILNKKILSFEDKYLTFSESFEQQKNIPPRINKKLYDNICKLAKICYQELDCRGIVRVDFIYDNKDKTLYINEINTIPGAMALYLFEAKGMDRKSVINDIVHEAIRVNLSGAQIETIFNSSVLNDKGLSKFNSV